MPRRDMRSSAKEVEKLLSRFYFLPKTARREDDTMKYKHLVTVTAKKWRSSTSKVGT